LNHANQAGAKAQAASGMAFRKLLVLALVSAVCAGGIGTAIWTRRKRENPFSPV